jgi:hypothetical protein
LLYPTAPLPFTVAMADLDGDGRLDVVLSNGPAHPSPDGSVSVFLGLGDGTFRPRVDYRVPANAKCVAVGDVDRDGRTDVVAVGTIVMGSVEIGKAHVLLGNGDGTLRPPTPFATGEPARSATLADLDRDGDLDLMTERSVLLGNGDGTFRPPHVFGFSNETSAVVADLDGDGILDVATSLASTPPDDEPPPIVSVRLGRGDGTFGPAAGFGFGNNAQSLAIADMDRDGRPDLVVGNFASDDTGEDFYSMVSVLRNLGGGTFGGPRFHRTGNNPYAVAVTDLDADGWPDIATANFTGDPDLNPNSVTVLLSNRDGTYRRVQDLPGGEYPRALAVGDLDGDRAPDVVAVSAGSRTISVMLGNGDGTLGARTFPTSRPAATVHPCDLDGDGELDLGVKTGERRSKIATLLGNGDGTFRPSAEFGDWAHSIFAAVGDVDADGRPDVAVVSETEHIVSTLHGNGDGTLGAQQNHATGQFPKGVQIVDLDGDGFAELVVANALVGSLSVFPGTGPGTFGAAIDYETGRFPELLAKADLNADGRWDLVVGNAGSATVSVFLGDGDGTLKPRIDFSTGDSPRFAAASDLDGDGFLDLALSAGRSVLIHRGHGDGTFDPGVTAGVHEDTFGLACADFDADGRLDLAVAHPYIRTISIHRGRGDLTFEPAIDFGAHAGGLAAADVNHDAMPDLLVAGGAITVMLNRTPRPVRVHPSLRIDPGTIERNAGGRWITATLAFGTPHSARDVDMASVRMQGAVPAEAAPGLARGLGSKAKEELVLRFDRVALAALLPAGEDVPVTVTGKIGNEPFSGTTTVRVSSHGDRSPVAIEDEASAGVARHALALHIASPARAEGGRLRFGITLEQDGSARLDLLDVAGRVVGTRELTSLARGPHDIELASAGALAPGVYFVRLRQGAREVRARAAVVR